MWAYPVHTRIRLKRSLSTQEWGALFEGRKVSVTVYCCPIYMFLPHLLPPRTPPPRQLSVPTLAPAASWSAFRRTVGPKDGRQGRPFYATSLSVSYTVLCLHPFIVMHARSAHARICSRGQRAPFRPSFHRFSSDAIAGEGSALRRSWGEPWSLVSGGGRSAKEQRSVRAHERPSG
jgi:hypothetical protein